MSIDHFDYIVVGAGSAGCVLANRLSADPGVRVLLLEAGHGAPGLRTRVPAAFYSLLQDPAITWPLTGAPEPFAKNRALPLQRGRLVGGTGAINGMTYSRGDPGDYDAWHAAGATGWSHADVLPYFRRAESNWRGETPWHGGDGPIAVSRARTDGEPFHAALMAGARALGAPMNDDICGATSEGFATVEFTIRNGRRSSTAAEYLQPALRRPNLVLRPGAQVARLVLEGRRAVGVEYVQDGVPREARARREVVLSGGAYNSPQLLMLSGIGHGDDLAAHGIPVAHHLPGVGANLQDHVVVPMTFEAARPVTFERELRADRFLVSALRWQLAGTGPLAQIPMTCWAFRKTLPSLPRADIQFFFSPIALNARVWFPGVRKGAGWMVTARNALRYPRSRGFVRLASGNAAAAPVIQSNMLAHAEDVASLVRAVRQTRELMTTPEAAALLRREVAPGPARATDADIEDYVRQNARTSCHPSGTCAMGTGEAAVVDPRLRVQGVAGLRVADASVMPTIVGGNLNAPTIMIAERAADLILQDAR